MRRKRGKSRARRKNLRRRGSKKAPVRIKAGVRAGRRPRIKGPRAKSTARPPAQMQVAGKKAVKKIKAQLASEEKLADELKEVLEHEAGFEAPQDRRKRRRWDQLEAEEERRAEASEQTTDRTPMRIYLDQIEHIPLLTPVEEVEIARKIRSKHRGAEEARQKMIRSNLRLVISIAKRYANMGLPFSDLVEEGNIGLMRAVEKFNPERGYRFSTYASWWIKQSMMRALSNQGKTIRIPVYMYDIISKWRKVRDGLMQKLNRLPTRKEIADLMEVPVQKIKEIENITGRPSSLNAPVSLDGSAELIDLIEDDASRSPEAQIGEMLKHERIQQLLNRLDERERRILNLRFGLGNEETHTLEEVAQEFDITRERVRQIEGIALQKIRQQLELENDRLENYLPPSS